MKELFDIISQNNWKDTLVGKYNKPGISKEQISGLGLKDRAQGEEKETEKCQKGEAISECAGKKGSRNGLISGDRCFSLHFYVI